MSIGTVRKKELLRFLYFFKAIFVGVSTKIEYSFYINSLNISKQTFCKKVCFFRKVLIIGMVLALSIVTILNFI